MNHRAGIDVISVGVSRGVAPAEGRLFADRFNGCLRELAEPENETHVAP